MNDGEDNFARAVIEWRHKHCIRDDDPMLATLELLEIFFQNVRIQIPDSGTATIAEVRAAIQQLDRLAKDFAKQSREVIVELRAAPQAKAQRGSANALVLAFICLIAGVLIGKFFL